VNHHLRSAQVWHVFSRDLTVLPAHPHVHLQSEWAIPAFAFQAIAGSHLPTPGGWKAELAWVAGYIVRQFTCRKAVTHPRTNRAQCIATTMVETNVLLVHCTDTSAWSNCWLSVDTDIVHAGYSVWSHWCRSSDEC